MLPDDKRWPLLKLLDNYLQRFPDEAETVKRYQDFISANIDCFDRDLEAGHVTGSALLLDCGRRRVLLTHHRKLNKWLQPGGHSIGEVDIMAIAMREALEESGLAAIKFIACKLLDLDIHFIPGRKNEPGHIHYDCRFLLGSDGSDIFVVSEESNDLAWVPMERITDYTTEASVRRMIKKAELMLRSAKK